MDSTVLLTMGIFVIVAAALNLIFLAIIYFMHRKAKTAAGWGSVTGTVLASGLERRRSSSNSGSVNYPVVLHSYRVMGQDYQSNVIAPGLQVGGSGAPKVVERYPIGSQMTIYFNPQNLEEAVLEKKALALLWLWVALVIMDFVLCGAVVPLLIFF